MASLKYVGYYQENTDINKLKKFTNNDFLVLDLRDCESSYHILDQVFNFSD